MLARDERGSKPAGIAPLALSPMSQYLRQYLVVVGSMAQVEHGIRAEALEGSVDGSWQGLRARGMGLVEPEDAEVCGWVIGAQAQQCADQVMQLRQILP